MDVNERARRYRARKRGENVPKLKPGPKKGYKQTNEHVLKRKRFGADHHAWLRNHVSAKGGRTRALREFELQPCAKCGNVNSERHHIDGDSTNNHEHNIMFLCRKCHMIEDGRYDQFRKLGKKMWKKAIAARWNKAVLP